MKARGYHPQMAAAVSPIQIHFVTGKGGVGKSTYAAALALKKSQEGLRTCLVELGHLSFFSSFLNVDHVEYKPVPTQFGFDLALWSGAECLKEYALHLLKIESLYRLFFENPVSRSLIQVAPALSELAILGKITSGPPRNVGPALNYDCLVVDSYATGHFLALLRAPKGMAEAIRFGAMGEQSRSIDLVIQDPKICHYHLVTLPEELPVLEALELQQALQSEFQIQAQMILNKTYPLNNELGPKPSEFENFLVTQGLQAESARSALGQNLRELPFVFENQNRILIQNLADKMKAWPQ